MLSHLKGFNLSNSKLINMLLICYWGEDQIQSPFALLPVCWDPPQRQQSLCLGDIRNYPVAEFIIMSCHKNSHKYSSQIVTQNRGKGTEYWRRPATVGGCICITWVSLWGQCMEWRLLEDAGAELQEGKIECFWSNSFCCLMFECRMTCRPTHGSMNSQPDHLAILDSTRIEANHDKQTANIT